MSGANKANVVLLLCYLSESNYAACPINGEESEIAARKTLESGIARRLASLALSELDVSLSGNEVRKDEYGKPITEGAYLSFSHTRSLVAVAASFDPVGCDVERKRAGRNVFRLIERIANEDEKGSFLKALDKEACFYSLWTAKEAVFKRFMKPPFSPKTTPASAAATFSEGEFFLALSGVGLVTAVKMRLNGDDFEELSRERLVAL